MAEPCVNFDNIFAEADNRYAAFTDTDFLKLEDAFETQSSKSPRVVALTGKPSSGKSSLAKYFASQKARSEDFKNVIWVNAESHETIWATYLQLRHRETLSTDFNLDSDLIKEILGQLNQERTLLIFDGLQTTTQIQQVLETYVLHDESSPNLHVLLTATEDLDTESLNLEVVHLSPVSLLDKSVLATLQKNTGSDEQSLTNLMWSFDTLVELETAAKVYRFVEALEGETQHPVQDHAAGNALENLWFYCFEKLTGDGNHKDALKLIDICCLFGPCGIPVKWLQTVASQGTFEEDFQLVSQLLHLEGQGTTVATWDNVQRSARLKALVGGATKPEVILFLREFLAKFTESISSFHQSEVAEQRLLERLSCLFENLVWIVKEVTSQRLGSFIVAVKDIVTFLLNVHENPWIQRLTAKYLRRLSSLEVTEELQAKVMERLKFDEEVEKHAAAQFRSRNPDVSHMNKPVNLPIRNFNFKLQVPAVWANRDHELLELQKALEGHQAMDTNQSKIVVIHGMAGIGKTALVQYYGCWAYLQGRFGNYIWIDASNNSSMSEDFKKLLASGLCLGAMPDEVDGQAAAEVVYNTILTDPTLIVFHNARGGEDDGWLKIDSIHGFLPGLYAPDGMVAPTVIVTSRNGDTWDDLNVNLSPLSALTPGSTASYIRQRLVLAEVPFTEDQIEKLAVVSEGHPGLAVAFIAEISEKRSVQNCLDILSTGTWSTLPALENICRSILVDLEYHPYGPAALAILKVCALLKSSSSLDSISQVLYAYPPIRRLRSPEDGILNGMSALLNFSAAHVLEQQVSIMSVLEIYVLDRLTAVSQENREFLVSCLPFILEARFKEFKDGGDFKEVEEFIVKLKHYPEYPVFQRIIAEYVASVDQKQGPIHEGGIQAVAAPEMLPKLLLEGELISNKTTAQHKGESAKTASISQGYSSKSFEDQVYTLMENHKLELDDSRRDAILVLGRTGVGKSTMVEVLFGDVSALESTFDDDHLCIRIHNTKEDPAMRQRSMFQSDTISPKLYTDQTNPKLAIYDCPGFCDTRGTSNEIATGVYLSEIVQHANRVKIVVAVDYDSVKPNADRSKFTDMILPEVLDFVLDSDIYQGGVFLLVTKYGNPNEDLNGKFSDEDIVDSIAEFLREAREYAVGKMKDRKSPINALFRKSWLLQNNGKYPNIGFSRTITRVGKLSDIESCTRRTQLRTQLLENPFFTFQLSDGKNFGCPISEAAKLDIRYVLRNLELESEELLRTVGQKIINTFIDSLNDKDELSRFFDHYITFLNDLDRLTEEESGWSCESVKAFRWFGNNIKAGTADEINQLNETVKRMKYLTGVDVGESEATRKRAHDKWNEAVMRIAKDLVIEFRKAQRVLALEAHQLLQSVGQQIVIKCAKSNDPGFYERFNVFTNNIQLLTEEEPGLNDKSLEVLREFGNDIDGNIGNKVDQLGRIVSCLKYLTCVDIEQSSITWSDVHLKWDSAIRSMEKDVAQIKAHRDFAEAEAQGELAIARAEAEVLKSKTKGELAEAIAQKELAEAKAEAERVKAKAQNDLLLAEAERAAAEARARAEIAEARARAEIAEANQRAAEAQAAAVTASARRKPWYRKLF